MAGFSARWTDSSMAGGIYMEASDMSCGICAQLKEKESSFKKFGRDEGDSDLPAAAEKLVLVKDFRPGSSRASMLKKCPECGTYYLYESDYEYLVNGTEDEEFLCRLSAGDARGILDGLTERE